MKGKPRQILFLGTHGQFNIGDELLLETFLSQLGSEHQFAVNSYDPAFTQGMLQPRFKAEAFHTTRELPRFLKYLFSSDLLFFGGGSIIASVGRNPYATLWMILATVTFAKQIARKKVVMSNISVGPLMTPHGERLARWILKQVDFLSVCDNRSLRTTLKLGLSPQKVHLVPDAAFANRPEVFAPEPHTQPLSDRTRIALNLNYDIENPAAWEPFLDNLAQALKQVDAETPLEIHALPMQSKFKANDDLSVLKEFARRIPDIPFVAHDPQTAQEAGQILSSVEVVLAERLHALVISSILGKPFFGLVYDVKVRELVDYLGMTEHSLDINQPFQPGDLANGLRQVLKDREALRSHLLRTSKDLRAQLGRYFDGLKIKAFPR